MPFRVDFEELDKAVMEVVKSNGTVSVLDAARRHGMSDNSVAAELKRRGYHWKRVGIPGGSSKTVWTRTVDVPRGAVVDRLLNEENERLRVKIDEYARSMRQANEWISMLETENTRLQEEIKKGEQALAQQSEFIAKLRSRTEPLVSAADQQHAELVQRLTDARGER